MKKFKFGRMMILVLAVVTVFAFSTTAFAYTNYTTISASSSTSKVKLDVGRTYTDWAAAGSYFTGSNNTVRLTVRPYQHNTSTRLSLAKTYSPSVQSGGQFYEVSADRIDVKANSSENGVLCGVTGTWRF
jgi:hypothetical protein